MTEGTVLDFSNYCDIEIREAQHRVHRLIGKKVRYAKRDIAVVAASHRLAMKERLAAENMVIPPGVMRSLLKIWGRA